MKRIISSVELLSEDEMYLIHDAALNTLEKTGFSVPNEEVLRRLKANGAILDEQRQIARIPKEIMEDFVVRMQHRGILPLNINLD